MNQNVNETHNPKLKSWVESANDTNSDFPIQNLPFGVFKRKGAEVLWFDVLNAGDRHFLATHGQAIADGLLPPDAAVLAAAAVFVLFRPARARQVILGVGAEDLQLFECIRFADNRGHFSIPTLEGGKFPHVKLLLTINALHSRAETDFLSFL